MRRITCVVLLLTAASLMSAQETDSDQEHAKWIASVMDSIQTVKPGRSVLNGADRSHLVLLVRPGSSHNPEDFYTLIFEKPAC